MFYWTSKEHPIIDILKNNLPIFNDYFVENFHSSLRYQTVESNSELQIIQKAKIIDVERNNSSFEDSFVNLRNPAKSQIKELKSLEKKVSLFLFSIFDKICQNIGNTKQINNDKYPKFYLPSFDIEIDVKVLPLGWNTQKIPADDKFCDADNCLLPMDLSNGIVLICGHSFHKRFSTPLRENEIPLFEDKNNNNNENDDDENIENILERIEYDVEN